jgi:hypothetical protein
MGNKNILMIRSRTHKKMQFTTQNKLLLIQNPYNVKFALLSDMKAQTASAGIAVLFL